MGADQDKARCNVKECCHWREGYFWRKRGRCKLETPCKGRTWYLKLMDKFGYEAVEAVVKVNVFRKVNK